MALDIDAAALLVYRAAWTKDKGAARVSREAAMAKLHCHRGGAGASSTRRCKFTAATASVPIIRSRRCTAKSALRIYEGASDVQKIIIARAVSSMTERYAWQTSALGPARMSVPSRATIFRPADQWPDLLLDRPEFQYPEYLNAAVETDRSQCRARLRRPRHCADRQWPPPHYKGWPTGRTGWRMRWLRDYGVKPSNARVLVQLRQQSGSWSRRWLAATKAGAVVVNTMPMLRAGELGKIVESPGRSSALASCDQPHCRRTDRCAKTSKFLKQVVNFDGTSNHDAELDPHCARPSR